MTEAAVAWAAKMSSGGFRKSPAPAVGNQGPEIPTEERVSWAAKVAGGGVGGRPIPAMILDASFVRSHLKLSFQDGEGGDPQLRVGNEVLDVMRNIWKFCIVAKVLSRRVPLVPMEKKLRQLWKPTGGMYLIDLPRHQFMVQFEKEEDYLRALTGGPWTAFASYLLVQVWNPAFDPQIHDITTTPVWIRINQLPLIFYHPEIILGMGAGFGNPIRVDTATEHLERAQFARVCVEVDLRKPLKRSITVNGVRFEVTYERLTKICGRCGIYGHEAAACYGDTSKTGSPVDQHEVVEGNQEATQQRNRTAEKGKGKISEKDNDGFTMVKPTGGRQSPAGREDNRGGQRVTASRRGNQSKAQTGSRYRVLQRSAAEDVGVSAENQRDKKGMQEKEKEKSCQTIMDLAGNMWKSEAGGPLSRHEHNLGQLNIKEYGDGTFIASSSQPQIKKPRQKKVSKPRKELIFSKNVKALELEGLGKRVRLNSKDRNQEGDHSAADLKWLAENSPTGPTMTSGNEDALLRQKQEEAVTVAAADVMNA